MENELPKSSIEQHRERINNIDTSILQLLFERAEIAKVLGELKGQEGKPIRDEKREAEVILKWKEEAKKQGLPEDKVEIIVKAIIELSRSIQE